MDATTQDPAIDSKAFRRALGNFATGVTIITACAPDGTTVGVTASSFNSLSMDPPLILWSSIKGNPSCAIFEQASHFAVNILASDQMDMSNHFARQQPDKFAGIDWELGVGGAPIFPNCAGRFQCETYAKLDGGDHWIFVGRVVEFDDFGRPPLCFCRGSYAMVFDHPGTTPKITDQPSAEADGELLGNHTFFLMMRAVRAYQGRYQPLIEELGLSLIESRSLLVLDDLSGLTPEDMVPHLHAPINEARAALINLADRGLVAAEGAGYVLTAAGSDSAKKCWGIAKDFEEKSFDGLSADELATFDKVLRQLINP
jgi:flavin reductase (DIM6/NTAB) family NADH-FMN oxidoreductase RutF/DNA-binding MarR family transcriptional regulator